MKFLKILTFIIFCGFAGIGLVFSGVFVAMRLHLTDVEGSIDSRNEYFNVVKKEGNNLSDGIKKNPTNFNKLDPVLECKIMVISSVLPENGQRILDTYIETKSSIITEKMLNAVLLVTENNNPFLREKINKCNEIKNNIFSLGDSSSQSVFSWMLSSEWKTLRDALIKDKDIILQASRDSGIGARMIVSAVISEQFRFFTSNRESYKRYFEPLKLLGNSTKFSYGVAGVKFETAKIIEKNLKDKNSPFYLGDNYEDMLNYESTENPDSVLMNRLTNTKSHYYSYLYTGVFLRQITKQWENAGYPINNRPEVLGTLFNLGFHKSVPKENPEVGGSTIVINDRDYTFGGLSYEFYYSGELLEFFPFDVE